MKTINRQEAIEKIVECELKNRVKEIQEEDFSYFEDLIRNGGFLIGFENMDNRDLELEYFEIFDEEVHIE